MGNRGPAAPDWEHVVAEHGLTVRSGCAVCEIGADALDNLHAAYMAGHRGKFYRAYMDAIGRPDISAAMVQNHINRGHHERA
jgi:hypothetical protein